MLKENVIQELRRAKDNESLTYANLMAAKTIEMVKDFSKSMRDQNLQEGQDEIATSPIKARVSLLTDGKDNLERRLLAAAKQKSKARAVTTEEKDIIENSHKSIFDRK